MIDTDNQINLKAHTSESLTEALDPLGFTARQARQVMVRAMVMGSGDLTTIRGMSKAKTALLKTHTYLPHLEKVEVETSEVDGFRRYLFSTADGHLVEAVRIPLKADRFTICISSQVGCALGCVFCETGKLGFKRNLKPWEMVDQVLQIRDEAPHPITGVVFMGQGEPFLNYEAVIHAANILNDPNGGRIKAEAITVSTAGILPAMKRFTAEGHSFKMILSLSAATSEKRRAIMPIEKKYPIDQLIGALRDYAASRRTRATIAWVAIEGVNTSHQDVEELRRLVEGLPIRLNVIEVNDPSGVFLPPQGDAFDRFIDRLKILKAPIVRRYTGGKEIGAACGLLASTHRNAGHTNL